MGHRAHPTARRLRRGAIAVGAASLAAGAAVGAAVLAVLVATALTAPAGEVPPLPEAARVTLLSVGLGFAVTALLALLPSALGVAAISALSARGQRPGWPVAGAAGVLFGWVTLASVLGTLDGPLWAFAALAGLAGGVAAERTLHRA